MSIQQMGNVTVVNQNTKRETGRKAQLGNIAAAKVCPSIHHLLKKRSRPALPPHHNPPPPPPTPFSVLSVTSIPSFIILDGTI